jgi:hypothetical protein
MGAFVDDLTQGDVTAYSEAALGCGGNRAPGPNVGSCHTFTYNLLPPGQGKGFVGVSWVYPANNIGALPGYAMPPGATRVTFWVRGATGGEVVSFYAGGHRTPTAAVPCVDSEAGAVSKMTLPATWTQVTMMLTGTYPDGVVDGFTWIANAGGQPSGTSSITFYVDGIQWEM